MALISLDSVSFHYGTDDSLFHDLSLSIDTGWKTGLIGRNGRGKSTLLKLICGISQPSIGRVSTPVDTYYFPYQPPEPRRETIKVIRESVAPFEDWETQMERLLADGSEESLHAYADIQERYQSMGGYLIDGLIEREFSRLDLSAPLLKRPFESLSGGEQTRSLIAALFLRQDAFALIDEPTNHLDIRGRDILGQYLAQKQGFILVSHDRYFLDLCVDHIVSIGKSGVTVSNGDYSSWRYNWQLQQDFEQATNAKLAKEISQIQRAYQKRRVWADRKEREKIGAADKGHIGHMSAKLMKRAISLRRRVEERVAQKRQLFKDRETEYRLHLEVRNGTPEVPLVTKNLAISLGDTTLVENLSIDVHRGDRVAILGSNGCGKTSLLNAIEAAHAPNPKPVAGPISVTSGTIYIPAYLTVARSHQIPSWKTGQLSSLLEAVDIDVTRFRTIMGELGITGAIFERPLETYSEGELKKVDLCRTLCEPAHVVLWDEPLNYLDVQTREQLEESLLLHKPTLVYVEHDRYFVESVATEIIELK